VARRGRWECNTTSCQRIERSGTWSRLPSLARLRPEWDHLELLAGLRRTASEGGKAKRVHGPFCMAQADNDSSAVVVVVVQPNGLESSSPGRSPGRVRAVALSSKGARSSFVGPTVSVSSSHDDYAPLGLGKGGACPPRASPWARGLLPRWGENNGRPQSAWT